MTTHIDLKNLGGPVYVGRDKGIQARKKYNLDLIDSSDEIVEINIPEGTYSINSSFFLGFFGISIRNCGSKEKFLNKFQFKNAELFQDKIDDFISRALFEKKPLV